MNEAEARWNEVKAETGCSEAEAEARFSGLEAEDLTRCGGRVVILLYCPSCFLWRPVFIGISVRSPCLLM